MRKVILRQWGRILAGLAVFAAGVHLTIYASIGLAPWDCLSMGISYHTPLNYGLAATAVSVLILVIDLLLGERIGFGTVLDALLVGNLAQLFNSLHPPREGGSLPAGVAWMLAGLAVMAVGQWLYMGGAQGCGPRDALVLALGRRLRRVPIGIVEVLIWAAALALGALLGGPVGPGTLIGAFGAGLVMHLLFSLIRFEPREIRHRDVLETLRLLRDNPAEEETT